MEDAGSSECFYLSAKLLASHLTRLYSEHSLTSVFINFLFIGTVRTLYSSFLTLFLNFLFAFLHWRIGAQREYSSGFRFN
jgi:hypothetical protein